MINSLNLMLLLVAVAAVGPASGQNQTPANVSPPAWRSVAWRDPSTELMWALRDNGSYITQPQALNYCRNLSLAGFTDWRLPEIDELAQIYDPSVAGVNWTYNSASYDLHVKGGITMTAFGAWSATRGNGSGSAWYFSFLVGKRDSRATDTGALGRALCVRRAGE